MSPEQAQGQEADHLTDIWALGVVLYEMLTGKIPFTGDYDQVVMYAIVNEDPEPTTAVRTGVPMELERVVNKALFVMIKQVEDSGPELIVVLNWVEELKRLVPGGK